MLKLRRMTEFDKAIYHGFTLKNGFWYGVDTETGKYIAASGWESAGNTAVYFQEGTSWIMRWIDVDSEFYLENIPKIDFEGKMSFNDWLESTKGITPEEFDEFYNGDEEYEEYNSYLYDRLPQFVINYIERNISKEIFAYADPKYNYKQMEEIKFGLEENLDVSVYADPKYDADQMFQIRLGLENKIDISTYADPKYDAYQMRQIRQDLMGI